MGRFGMLIILLLVAAMAAPAAARERMPARTAEPPEGAFDDAPGAGGPPSEEKKEEIRKKIEAVRVWRMTEALRLDEKTAAKFIPVISALDQRLADLVREKRETMRELQLFLDSPRPDEKKLKAAIEKIERNRREMMNLREKKFEAAREHLTVEQQARFVVFQHEFQHELWRMIKRARGGPGAGMDGPGRGKMGPGMGPGPGNPGGP